MDGKTQQITADNETKDGLSISVQPSRSPLSEQKKTSLLEPKYRTATVGIVGLVSLIAFEAMGSATVMPEAAAALGGLSLYGFIIGGPLAVSIVGMVAAGRWSDQHSPIRAVRVGSCCFAAGLIITALSGSIWWLLFGRLATGLGSGMVAVALYALVGRVYPVALHSKIFAAFSAAWILPSLIGPGLSGLIALAFGWRYAVVTAALLTLPVFLLLTRVRFAKEPVPQADVRGTNRMLWALGAAGAALTLHYLGQSNFDPRSPANSSLAALPILGVALAVLVLSARQLLPRGSLSAQRGLPAAIALSGLSQGAFFAAEAFLPLLLYHEKGATVGLAGLVLSIGAISWSAGAFCRARLYQRLSTTVLLRCGHSLLAGGIVVSAFVLIPGAPMLVAIVGWAIAGAGMGLVSPTLSVMTLVLSSAGTHGRAGASLRLSAALMTTSALTVSGAIFALLLGITPFGAFAASLGLAASLAVCGAFVADRVESGEEA